MVLVHETENVHGKFDFAAEKAACPEDLRHIFSDIESIAYRRRDHERNAMLVKVADAAGYSELLAVAKAQASTLAPIPPEVLHWADVEAFQEREAHQAVKHALMLEGKAAAQCVVAHGMGGTGTPEERQEASSSDSQH